MSEWDAILEAGWTTQDDPTGFPTTVDTTCDPVLQRWSTAYWTKLAVEMFTFWRGSSVEPKVIEWLLHTEGEYHCPDGTILSYDGITERFAKKPPPKGEA